MSEPRYRPDRFVPRRVQQDRPDAETEGERGHDDGRRPRWRRHLVGAGLAWLVLMTIWGFGRAADPADADLYLIGGLLAGGVAWIVTARR